jgi:hypothetical protein
MKKQILTAIFALTTLTSFSQVKDSVNTNVQTTKDTSQSIQQPQFFDLRLTPQGLQLLIHALRLSKDEYATVESLLLAIQTTIQEQLPKPDTAKVAPKVKNKKK